MKTPMSKFKRLYKNRMDTLRDWKRQGKKAFGYFCTYTPEEIICAAGILPFRITADAGSTILADAHLPSFICPFMRNCFDIALGGGYRDIDGYVSAYTCDTVRNVLWLWSKRVPTKFMHLINFPSGTTEEAVDFFLKELLGLRRRLGEFCGGEISDQSLSKAIRKYNENRTLLRKLYYLRKSSPPIISGTEAVEIVRSSMVVPKEGHTALLKQFMSEVEDRNDSLSGRVRMLVSGSFIQDISLLQIIERSGGTIVADDVCLGSRYFWDQVDEKADPLEAIARRYLSRVKCPCRHPPEDRLEHMIRMIKEFKVEAVVFVLQKFCDTHFFDYPFIQERLRENDIPVLLIEVAHLTTMGSVRTRVEAFIEMLTGVKT